jgi:exodeoxyribonuclease V beta subunit
VHTIDAWCQRMLREHAFDSGCLFDETLNANERALQIEAAQDCWRQQLYPLAGEALDVALGVWKNVAALSDDAHQLAGQALPANAGQGSLGDLIEGLARERGAKLATLKTGWSQRARDMQAWLDEQLADKACPFNKSKLSPRFYQPWLDELASWADDPQVDRPDMKTGLKRLTPAGMQEAVKPGAVIDLPEHFAAFEQLLLALDRLAPVAASLRLHAAACIARRLSELKSQAGTFGFADMLTRLDDALDPSRNGANAERLRARMLAQYPVALVDEFQDTSPVQSRIFDRLYRIAANDRATALLLIGDPKQAIYGFRGADIYSYLMARRATEGRHYVLGTNHRSTQALVAAVNHLFEQAEARAGEGAFMFRADVGAEQAFDNPLPFVPVSASGRSESFVTSVGAGPALTLALDAEPLDAKTGRREFAARCAERIVTLLNDERAGFVHPGRGFSRLRPADIAVLVRTGKEAAAVRRELRRRNVASVYLSDQVSVFASGEARDLLHWLKAVAAPRDVRLARAALATRTVGLTINELVLLATDDEAFDARSEQLRQLHAVWQGQGVLSMLRQTLHLLDLPARWLGSQADGVEEPDAEADGERRLTNVLHLAELLQTASAQLDGEQALIRWLAGQIAGDPSGGDEQILRLESDADLVKVATIHKSKGLEYPLVFLPFAGSFRPVDTARTLFVSLADAQGQRTLHLPPSKEQLASADRERHREDLRLLYVALTRARHAVWVGLGVLKKGSGSTLHRSAIGYVLGGTSTSDAAALTAHIEAVVRPSADVVLMAVEAPAQTRRTLLRRRGVPIDLCEPAPYAASFERRWSIGSFSALVRALPAADLWSSSAAVAKDDEAQSPGDLPSLETPPSPAAAPLPARTSAPSGPWHRFPRGAVPGNFLHDQLEWLAGEGFDLAASAERQEQLLQRCEREGWGPRGPDVLAWLTGVTTTVLPPVGAALADLRAPRPEMEFWFPSEGVAASEVDALCRTHLLGGRDRPVLPQRELRGMLMGFADLVFEHQGRYWVLDYKSNHLGANDADYTADALEAAMAAHRYDVQAALYLLALHRLLQARLGEVYDPARQLGGAVFFFLRGIQGSCRGCYQVTPSTTFLAALEMLLRHSAEVLT